MKSKDWPDDLISAICAVIRERRASLGLSIYTVSQLSGVSQQAISYFEREMRRPTLESLARLSVSLQLKVSELIALAEKRLNR